MRLIFQGSTSVSSVEEAKLFYDFLKNHLKSRSVTSTLNGQVVELLEPCCGERRGLNVTQLGTQIPER
jgi:hypothetical protein